jgi:hypothetical protein
MPTSGAEMPIHLVPSGLPGPGGIGWALFAQAEAGGYHHHGRLAFVTILKRPSGVGELRRPVLTVRARTSLTPRYR